MEESAGSGATVFERWLAQAREEGVDDGVLNKRSCSRIAWAIYVEVAGEGAERLTGRTRDISEGGIGLQCRKPLPERTRVRIYRTDTPNPDEYVEGEVVHSTGTVGGFKIGVRVTP